MVQHYKKLQSVVPWFKKKPSNTQMGLLDIWLNKFKTNDAEHNIVPDEWAEESNLQPHTPTHTLTHTLIVTLSQMRGFRVHPLVRLSARRS